MNNFYLKIEKTLLHREELLIADMSLSYKNKTEFTDKKKYKIAAVLFPLIEKKEKINVILTTRSKSVGSHPGRFVFLVENLIKMITV